MPRTEPLTESEAAMIKRAFDVYNAAPTTIAFISRVGALQEIHGLPPTAQLSMPDCKAFLVPDAPQTVTEGS